MTDTDRSNRSSNFLGASPEWVATLNHKQQAEFLREVAERRVPKPAFLYKAGLIMSVLLAVTGAAIGVGLEGRWSLWAISILTVVSGAIVFRIANGMLNSYTFGQITAQIESHAEFSKLIEEAAAETVAKIDEITEEVSK